MTGGIPLICKSSKNSIQARVATRLDNANIRFSINGIDKTEAVTVPYTGDWQNFTNITIARDVPLTRGVQQVKVEIVGDALTLDKFSLSRS